ncbi:MAG: molybdenum ABC transporter ATP-binding protein [Deltaproteobacteria bacterium]|nr:molybdenum ABC transporter ATP-binding protein [Deltaproteobacteria bacterium]
MLEVRVRTQLGGFLLDVRFTAPGRGITALFGPSGAGKSSLISTVTGLLRPEEGRIVLKGRVLFDSQLGVDLPPHQRVLGCVFQDGRLFPHLSVRSNLFYGYNLVPPERRRIQPDDVLSLLGIEHLLDRRPARLSGGEKQRVAVGRALLTSPDLLLMDEPLASLDQARKEEMLPFLSRLPAELDIPMLYVTHDPAEIAALGASLIPIDQGQIPPP